jgi:hypothetical protein
LVPMDSRGSFVSSSHHISFSHRSRRWGPRRRSRRCRRRHWRLPRSLEGPCVSLSSWFSKSRCFRLCHQEEEEKEPRRILAWPKNAFCLSSPIRCRRRLHWHLQPLFFRTNPLTLPATFSRFFLEELDDKRKRNFSSWNNLLAPPDKATPLHSQASSSEAASKQTQSETTNDISATNASASSDTCSTLNSSLALFFPPYLPSSLPLCLSLSFLPLLSFSLLPSLFLAHSPSLV